MVQIKINADFKSFLFFIRVFSEDNLTLRRYTRE
jgi:hypothetical protein